MKDVGYKMNIAKVVEKCGEKHITTEETIEFIKILLKKGVDINKTDWEGNNALYLAIQHKNLKLAKFLLENGATPNLTNNEDISPLFYIIEQGYDISYMRLLLDNGADANIINNNGYVALMGAIKVGDKSMVELLLKHGAKPEIRNNLKSTSYDLALQKNKFGIYKMLLSYDIQN